MKVDRSLLDEEQALVLECAGLEDFTAEQLHELLGAEFCNGLGLTNSTEATMAKIETVTTVTNNTNNTTTEATMAKIETTVTTPVTTVTTPNTKEDNMSDSKTVTVTYKGTTFTPITKADKALVGEIDLSKASKALLIKMVEHFSSITTKAPATPVKTKSFAMPLHGLSRAQMQDSLHGADKLQALEAMGLIFSPGQKAWLKDRPLVWQQIVVRPTNNGWKVNLLHEQQQLRNKLGKMFLNLTNAKMQTNCIYVRK
jgi:hypothetical protein